MSKPIFNELELLLEEYGTSGDKARIDNVLEAIDGLLQDQAEDLTIEHQKELGEKLKLQLEQLIEDMAKDNVTAIESGIRSYKKQMIKQFDEIIGEDENILITNPDTVDFGKYTEHPFNELRQEQRKKLDILRKQ